MHFKSTRRVSTSEKYPNEGTLILIKVLQKKTEETERGFESAYNYSTMKTVF